MCELLGASFRNRQMVNDYLKEFFSHSVKHPHGWGVMREVNGEFEVLKEPICAAKSELAECIIKDTEPQKNLLAHIRLATVGAKSPENCHPFFGSDKSGRHWTIIHNGTIYSDSIIFKYREIQKGGTDSERIYLYLIDLIHEEIEKNGNLSPQQRFEVIDGLVKKLSKRNKLNLMIYDGELLYVHKNMEGTLYYKKTLEGIIISTQPLDGDEWSEFPTSQLIAFRDGERLFEGTAHGKIFVPTLQYITAMDAMNI